MILGDKKLLNDNDINYNGVFCMREQVGPLLAELGPMLRYLWRQRHCDLSAFIEEARAEGATVESLCYSYLAPRMILAALLQEVEVGLGPIALHHLGKARMFKKETATGRIVLLSANPAGKHVAAIMHLVRLAACGACYHYLSIQRINRRLTLDIVQRIGESPALNLLGPLVRRLREIERSKPPVPHSYILEDEGIGLDDFVFKREHYERLIPALLSKIKKLLPEMFVGEDYKLVMDLKYRVQLNEETGHSCVYNNEALMVFDSPTSLFINPNAFI